MKNLTKFVVSILICLGAGVVGSLFTAPAILGWYAGLEKSPLNPPGWVFGPVWTVLYILMGISLFLVWKNDWKVDNQVLTHGKKAWNKWSQEFWAGKWQKQNAIAVFGVQLVLNILWSVIFFGWHEPGWAFFEIIALWVAIIYTIVNFYRISKPAAWLLVPYLLWVSFASYLNYAVLMLNGN